MAGKKYADYSWDLYYKYLNLSSIDIIERQKMTKQIKETALKTGSKAWELELKYAELAEFHVKEAIRLLSDKNAKVGSLDMIASLTGFNNRISFHRAFKKITGLSPAEFRKNVID